MSHIAKSPAYSKRNLPAPITVSDFAVLPGTRHGDPDLLILDADGRLWQRVVTYWLYSGRRETWAFVAGPAL